MLDLLSGIKNSDFSPSLNIGCLHDIPTGIYLKGIHGENLLSGGMSNINAMCGRGNMYKTAFLLYWMLSILDRYISCCNFYDCEDTMQLMRIVKHARKMLNYLLSKSWDDESFFKLTRGKDVDGTEWFTWLKSISELRSKLPKDQVFETPFLDKEGKKIKILFPFVTVIDSFSMFYTKGVEKIQEKGIGESERNMEFMRDGSAKTQMLRELNRVNTKGGIYTLMSAHVGDEHQLDPYAPPSKKLAFLPNRSKLKDVPEKFTFLTTNCFQAISSSVLINQNTKTVEYPRNQNDDLKNDTDLVLVTVKTLRSKNGPSGIIHDFVISQSEGVQVSLTEFWYIKSYGRFGLDGNDRTYFLDLYPNVNLSRTTIRGKIENDPKLRRALEITSELCQMTNLWHDMPEGLLCTPKELYNSLKDKGYDWDRLLSTRGWWTFDNDKHPIPYLSTKDLLEMRIGTYQPYWY